MERVPEEARGGWGRKFQQNTEFTPRDAQIKRLCNPELEGGGGKGSE